MSRRWSLEDIKHFLGEYGFVLMAKEVPTITQKVHIVCPKGHDIYMAFHTFRNGNRCAECSGKKKPSIEKLRSSFNACGYLLQTSKYVNQHTHLDYVCAAKHENKVTWSNFRNGHRCPDCAGNAKHTYGHVVQAFKDRGLEVTSKSYTNSKEPIEFVCAQGHKSRLSFSNFYAGFGCNRCSHSGISKAEEELVSLYESKNIHVVHSCRNVIAPYELDLYFPEQRVAVEYCGLYWHSEVGGKKDKWYHLNKRKQCEQLGIRLVTVFDDEYRDKKTVVTSRIDNALGLTPNKIMARKTSVVQIPKQQARTFLNDYHLQNYGQAKVCYGMFHEGNLVGVLTGSSMTRRHTASVSTLELKRLCFLPNTTVVGGASKLFSRLISFAQQNGYNVINSYCDMWYGNPVSPVYEKIGFDYVSESKPSPSYIPTKTYGSRINCFSLRKTPEERLTGRTEWELRQEQGYDRVWDCGHRLYTYHL